LLWSAIGGVAHFAVIDAEMRIVPPSIPWPRVAVWIKNYETSLTPGTGYAVRAAWFPT